MNNNHNKKLRNEKSLNSHMRLCIRTHTHTSSNRAPLFIIEYRSSSPSDDMLYFSFLAIANVQTNTYVLWKKITDEILSRGGK